MLNIFNDQFNNFIIIRMNRQSCITKVCEITKYKVQPYVRQLSFQIVFLIQSYYISIRINQLYKSIHQRKKNKYTTGEYERSKKNLNSYPIAYFYIFHFDNFKNYLSDKRIDKLSCKLFISSTVYIYIYSKFCFS